MFGERNLGNFLRRREPLWRFLLLFLLLLLGRSLLRRWFNLDCRGKWAFIALFLMIWL